MIKILQPKTEYIIEYNRAIEYAERQSHILWTPTEVNLNKDIHDILTNLNDIERHGIISVLKLFTLYELRVGEDYWNTYLNKIFKRPELSRMFSTFSYVESGIHAPSMAA